MSLVWQCYRCQQISLNGGVDDPPDGWVHTRLPVRGSEGARSSSEFVICDACDDDLYLWFRTK